MGKKSLLLIMFALLCCWSVVLAQKNLPAEKTRADSLREDLQVFRKALNANYPSLYNYTRKAKMDAFLDSCYRTINSNTSNREFYGLIKLQLSTIKDGHLFGSAPAALQAYIDSKAKFFPLKLKFIAYHAYAFENYKAGTEVIAIDGRPIDAIRRKLFKYIVGDGDIQTKKYRILDNSFFIYYFITYGEQPYFSVKLKDTRGNISIKKVSADSKRNIIKTPGDDTTPLSLSITPNHIALLNIKSLDREELTDHHLDFVRFLDSTFKKISELNIKKLIIDVRGNGGGTDIYGALLYRYIALQPFHYYQSLTTATNNLPYAQFKASVSSYNNLTAAMLEKTGAHQYKLKQIGHPNLNIIQPVATPYTGKVWILTDGLSFSTTTEFCAVARSNNRAVFIGEETGGAYQGNTSGVQTELVLPNTKTELSLGTVKYNMWVKKAVQPSRGVIPDHIVSPNINEVITNYDVQLQYAYKLAIKD